MNWYASWWWSGDWYASNWFAGAGVAPEPTTHAPDYELPSATNTFSVGFAHDLAVGGPLHLARLHEDEDEIEKPKPVNRLASILADNRKQRNRKLAYLLLLD